MLPKVNVHVVKVYSTLNCIKQGGEAEQHVWRESVGAVSFRERSLLFNCRADSYLSEIHSKSMGAHP